MRPATPEEISRWDDLIAANPDGGNPLQLEAFGKVKATSGWESRHYMLGDLAVLVLARKVPGLGEFWYVPKGPGIITSADLKKFIAGISTPKPFAIRIDPEVLPDQIAPAQFAKLGFVKARNIQYNVNTAIIDLEPSEDEILASFKQKTRYNVRLAVKKGVTVEAVEATQATMDQMYDLYATTTKRAGVYLRPKQYFCDFWRFHSESGHGQQFFARYEGQVLAGAFITYVGHKGLYKDGGSVREHTEVQAPYLLQWEIVKWLKEHGVTEYDLHGTPPADQIDNPNHPLAGLARFKTGFQPHITEYVGTYDLILNPGKYRLWQRVGERAMLTYEYRVKHRLFY